MWRFVIVQTRDGHRPQVEYLPDWSVASFDAFHPTCGTELDLAIFDETPALLEESVGHLLRTSRRLRL